VATAASIVVAGLVATSVPAHARPASCGFPRRTWTAQAPSRLGLDASKLQDALDYATQHSSETVLVLRRGCLAGSSRLDAVTAGLKLDGWSMTKSVTALLVGRAVTLGKLDIDKPISRYFPEADKAHGRLTPRQLMHMASGLHLHWTRDFNGTPLMPDRVKDALSLAFDHKPGAYWEYTQSPVSLLAETITRAVGKDIQTIAQEELFGPIGIPEGSWTWDRDRAGHTEGWAHLQMRSIDWARLGTLVLHNGAWNGRQIVSRRYMGMFRSSSPSNHAYGFLTWLNGKDSFVMPGTNGRDEGKGWLTVNAPRDTIIFAGQDEQRIWVIPSLDMVVVRLGQKGSRELDMRVTFWTGRSGEFDNGFMLRLKRAVTDRKLDTKDRYRSAGFVMPSTGKDSWHGSLQDPAQTAAGVGAGPYAPEGCTPAGCG
jgi:CubicO group peptidase (beta-lactamase class C family)